MPTNPTEPVLAVEQGAIDALTNGQRQLDADGTFVGVSRQALDELLAWHAATATLQAEIAAKDAEIMRLDNDYRTLLAAYAELGVKLETERARNGAQP